MLYIEDFKPTVGTRANGILTGGADTRRDASNPANEPVQGIGVTGAIAKFDPPVALETGPKMS